MQTYRTTSLPEGFDVKEIMSFFSTCFDRAAITRERRETYPFWALIYTKSGSLTFRIGEKTYRVGAGEVIFYPPDLPHCIVSMEERSWEVSFITFTCASARMEELAGRVLLPDGETAEELRRLLRFGTRFFYNQRVNGDRTIGMYCNAGERELLRIKQGLEAVLTGLSISGGRSGERKSPVFNEAVEFMNAHLGEPMPLSRLATETGVSVSTLKSAFRKASGGGVNGYYIGLKLSRGEKLLRETDLSVGEIAESLGFSSQFYFSEQFKARYGLSPTAYRKQQEKGWQEFL